MSETSEPPSTTNPVDPPVSSPTNKRSLPPPPSDRSHPEPNPPPSKRPRNAANLDDSSRRSRFDASILPPSTDPALIIGQVEFYFSDANLPKDKFLWTETQKDPEQKGWVSIELICNFKRMQRFRPIEKVVEALRTSKDFLEVNEDGSKVRRKIPLDRPGSKEFEETQKRTVYVNGFGEETPSTQFDLEAFFSGFGPIASVRLRREENGKFKGSCFVQFKDAETAEIFLEEPQAWNDMLLETKSAKQRWEEKRKARESEDWRERRDREEIEGKTSGYKRTRFDAWRELDKQEKDARKRVAGGGKEKDRGDRQGRGRGRGRGGGGGRNNDRSTSPRKNDKEDNFSTTSSSGGPHGNKREYSPEDTSSHPVKREKFAQLEDSVSDRVKRQREGDLEIVEEDSKVKKSKLGVLHPEELDSAKKRNREDGEGDQNGVKRAKIDE